MPLACVRYRVGPFFPALAFGAPGYTASAAGTYFASEQLRCWE